MTEHADRPGNRYKPGLAEGGNGLPDLSAWHEVPRGARMPESTRYVFVRGDEFVLRTAALPFVTGLTDGVRYFTEQPITLPEVIQ